MSKKNAFAYHVSGLLAGRLQTQTGRALQSASVSFLTGLLAARAGVFGGLYPFGVALAASASRGDSIAALLGVSVGYLLPFGPEYAVRYVAAAAVAFVFRWLFSAFEISRRAVFAPVVAGLGTLLTGTAVVLSNGTTPKDIVLLGAETLLAACAALFFERALPCFRSPSALWGLRRRDLVCVLITLCVMLLALTGAQISGITLGRILGVLVLLTAARCGGEAGGCIAGTAAGVILGLHDPKMMFLAGAYAFGGLLAGVFSPGGRFAQAIALILSGSVVAVCSATPGQAAVCLYEIMAGSVIFLVLPERLLSRVSGAFFPAGDAAVSPALAGVPARLEEAAAALGEVGETVARVGQKLRGISERDVSTVYSEAAEVTCARCGMRMYCWGTAYNDTMDALNGVTETLRKNGALARDDIPRHFAGRCCRLGDLLASVNRCYAQFTAEGSAERRTEFLRGILTEQLGGLSEFLRQLKEEMTGLSAAPCREEEIRAAFSACGLSAGAVACVRDRNGRLSVEAAVQKTGKTALRRAELLGRLTRACGREMSGPAVTGSGTELVFRFSQTPALSCAFGRASIPKTGERLCGDSGDAFIDGQGRAVLMLSDGMGCGGRAAVDSTLTLRLLSRLMRAGFGSGPALRLVNAALMLKSGEESFATLDLAMIDLYTGEAEFLKAGSPPAYVLRGGRVERVAQPSLPVGILQEVAPARARTRLRRGDAVVVVSDGALCGDDAWLLKAIEAWDEEPPEAFAQRLAKTAKEQRDDGHDDDITVMAARLG